MSTARRRTRARRRASGDQGFGLIETVVAMLILSVVALAVLSVLMTAQRTAYGNRARVVAANLAASEMDTVRTLAREGLSSLPIGTGRSTARDVAGTRYTVDTEVEYVNTADPTSACATPIGVQKLSSVRINVAVTWPSMGTVPPVTSDTVIAPSFSDASSGNGTVVVRVVDRGGMPVTGASVQVDTASTSSSADGCAIFTAVAPGTRPVTVTKVGHITPDGAAAATDSISVVAGAATNVEKTIDRPAKLRLTGPVNAATWPLPTTSPAFRLFAYNVERPGGGVTVTRAGTETVLTDLFPYSGGYQVYAGHCRASGASGIVRTGTTEPGGDSAVAVDYAQVEVRAKWTTVNTGGAYVQFVSTGSPECPSATYTRGNSGAYAGTFVNGNATIRTSLPTGTYEVTVSMRDKNDGSFTTRTVSGVAVDAAATTPHIVQVTR